LGVYIPIYPPSLRPCVGHEAVRLEKVVFYTVSYNQLMPNLHSCRNMEN